MQKHEIQKSFQCQVCGDLFTFKTGLAKHIRLNRCRGPLRNYRVKDEDEEEDHIVAQKQLNEMSKASNKKSACLKDEEQTVCLKVEEQANESASDDENNFYEISDLPELELKVEIEESNIETKETRKSRKQKLHPAITSRQGRQHLIYTCDYCGEDVKFKKQILNHMKNHIVLKSYKCKECPDTFKSRKKIIAHSIEMHGTKPLTVRETIFFCEVCGKRFDQKSIFEAHKISHDDNARHYMCSHCSAAFKSVGNLHRHEATHNPSRDFECPGDDCKKRFKTKLALKIHNETVHPQVKVFVNCHICDVIIQEKYMKVHVRNQHTEEGKEKPFSCTLCNKTFKTEKLGQRHFESVHDPKNQGKIYACSKCPEAKFYRQRDLNQHSFIHFEGMIFQCETCLKMFKTKRLLSIHGAVHNGTGHFACRLCTNIVFKTRGGRRKHMVRVHEGLKQIEEEYPGLVNM